MKYANTIGKNRKMYFCLGSTEVGISSVEPICDNT